MLSLGVLRARQKGSTRPPSHWAGLPTCPLAEHQSQNIPEWTVQTCCLLPLKYKQENHLSAVPQGQSIWRESPRILATVVFPQSDNFRKHERLYPSRPKTNLPSPQPHPSPSSPAAGEVGKRRQSSPSIPYSPTHTGPYFLPMSSCQAKHIGHC